MLHKYQRVGGGSLTLRDKRTIRSTVNGGFFIAEESAIPSAFMDTINDLGPVEEVKPEPVVEVKIEPAFAAGKIYQGNINDYIPKIELSIEPEPAPVEDTEEPDEDGLIMTPVEEEPEAEQEPKPSRRRIK